MEIPENLEMLTSLVERQIEESLNLEFKRELPQPGKNDDLARDIAAFANSDGGVIIFGVQEDKAGRATDLVPLNLRGAAERISSIARSLDGPVHFSDLRTIPSPQGLDSGFIVAAVKPGARRPHLFRGEAIGRSQRGNYRLSRNELAHLFASSTGFANEFGLLTGKPGRLRVQVRTVRPSSVGWGVDSYLVFSNDGDQSIGDASWHWVTSPPGVTVIEDPFPLRKAPAGLELPVQFVASLVSPGVARIRTRWRDEGGAQCEEEWPLKLI